MAQKAQLWCAECHAVMHRSKASLPQGEARCVACRRAAVLARLEAAPTDCVRCGSALTSSQRREGGRFCSRRCAYLEYVGSEHRDKRDYKRKQLLGGIRFADVPRTPDGWPVEVGPHERTDRWWYGPPRLIWITQRHYDDGRVEIRCPSCWHDTERIDSTEGWCGSCAVAVYVYPPEPRRMKPRPTPVQVEAKDCPVCGALHVRPVYCSARCCTIASERRRAERKRKPPRTACPQGHPYTPENRRVRLRLRDGVTHIETECKPCNKESERRKDARRRATRAQADLSSDSEGGQGPARRENP